MDERELLDALKSDDENARAGAALTLAREGHPRALEACIAALDDAPSPAHADYTPAVFGLITIGLPGLPSLLPKLRSDSPMTRLHAQRAVEGISKRYFGYDGLNWPQGSYDRWAAWWQAIDYRYDAAPAERELAAARLAGETAKWVA